MTKNCKIIVSIVFILFIFALMKVDYETQKQIYTQDQEKQAYFASISHIPINYTTEKENSIQGIIEPVAAIEEIKWLSFTGYAYDACVKCCGKDDGITASGTNAVEGVTIAADWNVLPCGTMVEIIADGVSMGTRIVQDRGVYGNEIDIFMDSHSNALEFGIKKLKVRVIKNE